MARFFKDRKETKGTAPGSLVLIGRQKMDKPEIDIMEFDSNNLVEKRTTSIQDGVAGISDKNVTWINIFGIHDVELMNEVGKSFSLHPLLLADIMNTDHRPKYEEGASQHTFIVKMLQYDEDERSISAEQITLILGPDYLLTFQEKPGDVFDSVRDRIRHMKGKIRLNHADYLLFALLDTIVDNYMLIIERIGSQIEDLEEEILNNPGNTVVERIHSHKIELSFLRKVVRPVKDIMIQVMKSENIFIREQHLQYLHDLNDHIIHVTDAIELYSGLLSDQLNAYNSSLSNKMNEVMKVLTIFASIFIPLTFIAGIYGMNFENMPELKYKYAYLFFWIVALLVGFGLLVYFRRKKWL